jgi:hypothetical protein
LTVSKSTGARLIRGVLLHVHNPVKTLAANVLPAYGEMKSSRTDWLDQREFEINGQQC